MGTGIKRKILLNAIEVIAAQEPNTYKPYVRRSVVHRSVPILKGEHIQWQ